MRKQLNAKEKLQLTGMEIQGKFIKNKFMSELRKKADKGNVRGRKL